MAELVDARDLKSLPCNGGVGSSPTIRTRLSSLSGLYLSGLSGLFFVIFINGGLGEYALLFRVEQCNPRLLFFTMPVVPWVFVVSLSPWYHWLFLKEKLWLKSVIVRIAQATLR